MLLNCCINGALKHIKITCSRRFSKAERIHIVQVNLCCAERCPVEFSQHGTECVLRHPGAKCVHDTIKMW